MTSDRPNLALLLLSRFDWFEKRLRQRLNAADGPPITQAQSMVFAHLDDTGTRISDIARRTNVSRQAAHQTVGSLVSAGLLELVPDPDDRRAKLARPTAAGADSIRLALRIFDDLEDELSEALGVENVAELRRVLSADWP